jgi:hypothetical protein
LFRCGIARRLNGDKAGGDADVVAAKRIDPDLVEQGREPGEAAVMIGSD